MIGLLETTAFVFGLVALGYLAGATGYLKEGVGEALTAFAVGVAVPLLLFRTMAGAEFSGAAPWALWTCYFSAIGVAWLAGHLVTTRVFGREPQAGVVGGVSAAFSNLVLLGIPFVLGAFGQAGFEILSLLVAVHLPIMTVASVVQFRIFAPERTQGGPMAAFAEAARQISGNPLIIGILAGLAWRFAGQDMPSLLERIIDALAGIAGPLALFAMGLSLNGFGVTGNVRPALALSAIKLGLMPAAALLVAILIGLPPLTAKVAVAAAALPSGVNAYLIATQLGTGQALASNTNFIATACAVLTTAFWLYVAAAVF